MTKTLARVRKLHQLMEDGRNLWRSPQKQEDLIALLCQFEIHDPFETVDALLEDCSDDEAQDNAYAYVVLMFEILNEAQDLNPRYGLFVAHRIISTVVNSEALHRDQLIEAYSIVKMMIEDQLNA